MKTGVFDLPAPDYFAAHGVSQSMLKLLARSPAHLKHAIEHPEQDTPDQKIGTISHTAVFEPDLLEKSCYVQPASIPDEKGEWKAWHGNRKVCKDWQAARTDKPIISQDDYTDICGIRDSVFRHPAAALALKSGKAEQALFAEDAETGLQLKCKCDWLSGNAIVDLKTCPDASPAGFAKSVANWGYDMQSAFYLDLAALLNLGKDHFIFIAVEKTAPYAVGVYELHQESIDVGRSKYRRLLNRYLQSVVSEKWDAYSPNIEVLYLPEWAKKAEWNALLLEDSAPLPPLAIA